MILHYGPVSWSRLALLVLLLQVIFAVDTSWAFPVTRISFLARSWMSKSPSPPTVTGARQIAGYLRVQRSRSSDQNPDGRTSSGRSSAFWTRSTRNLYQLWVRLREFVRTRLERRTIYVLECEEGKYYVGMTVNRRRRLWQHMVSEKGGSAWTSQHTPIRVWKEYRRIPRRYALGWEAQVTAELMWKFGVNNVRGAMFAQRRLFDQSDLSTLVRFIGHHNSLPYARVQKVLQQSLPPAPSTKDTVRRQRARLRQGTMPSTGSPWMGSPANTSDRLKCCYQCGKPGHFAADCPSSTKPSRRKCGNCGNYGHITADCPDNNEKIAQSSTSSEHLDSETDDQEDLRNFCDICGEYGHLVDNCWFVSWDKDTFLDS